VAYHRRPAQAATKEGETVGDYDYEVQAGMAQADERDAGVLQTDATTLRDDGAAEHAQAAAVQGMGLPGEGQILDMTGTLLEGEAAGLDDRADHLHHSAGLEREGADILRERDTAAAGSTAAQIHAEGTEMVLDFVDLSEQDRTRWLGEQGAATGEASALHARAEALSGQGAAKVNEAEEERNAARDGLPGRQWSGVGHPSNQTPGASGAE
jgi:hypothetical protein